MKYQVWYDQIVARARGRSLDAYKETHHIIPRSLGGSDAPDNLVDLTYREHFLVHWLLTKICEGRSQQLMIYALNCMTLDGSQNRLTASWQFEVAKRSLRAMSIETQQQRRFRLRAEREHRRKLKETVAKNASVEAATLDPSRSRDREKLAKMTAEWMKAHPKWLTPQVVRRHIKNNTRVA